MSLGILHCHRAEAAHLARDAERARTNLDAACALAQELAAEPQSELGLAVARVRELFGERCRATVPDPGSVA